MFKINCFCLIAILFLASCTSTSVQMPDRNYRQIRYPHGNFIKTIRLYPDQLSILDGKNISKVSFNPSGKEFVFSLNEKNQGKIYKVNTDGSNLTALDTGSIYDFGPVFSPDGKMILFSSINDGHQADICLMYSDGSGKTCLTSDKSHDFSPVFSPDGKKIYFLRAKWFGNYSPMASPSWHAIDIYLMNIDGTSLEQVTFGNYYRVTDLSIRSDGSALMANFFIDGGNSMKWIFLDDNCVSEKPICPELHESSKPIDCKGLYSPQLSPDGKSILFTWDGNKFWGGQTEQLYVMDIATSKSIKITNMANTVWNAAFSSDGSKIVFSTWRFRSYVKECSLWILNNDGTNLHIIDIKK